MASNLRAMASNLLAMASKSRVLQKVLRFVLALVTACADKHAFTLIFVQEGSAKTVKQANN